MADSSGRNVLKYGCLGCLGLVVLAIVAVGVMLGIARMQVSSGEVERQTLETPLETLPEGTVGAGRVVLDLEGAEFRLDPGDRLAVSASYDRQYHSLEETFEPGDGGPWTYRLTFRREGSSWIAGLRRLMGEPQPELRVTLPRDASLDLEVRVREGGLETRLGGLRLNDVALDVSRGGIILDFDEPSPEPLRSLTLNGSMGGFQLSHVGNASPHRLEVRSRMGGFDLDLSGPWRNDAEIEIVSDMSGGSVQLPQGVRIEGIDAGGVPGASDEEVPPPLLRFRVDDPRHGVEFRD